MSGNSFILTSTRVDRRRAVKELISGPFSRRFQIKLRVRNLYDNNKLLFCVNFSVNYLKLVNPEQDSFSMIYLFCFFYLKVAINRKQKRDKRSESHTRDCRLAPSCSLAKGYDAINNLLYSASESCMRDKMHCALIRAINIGRSPGLSFNGRRFLRSDDDVIVEVRSASIFFFLFTREF